MRIQPRATIKNVLFCCLLLALLVGCKKEKIGKSDSAFSLKGHWKNYESIENYQFLSIDDFSGYIWYFNGSNKSIISEGKQWFLKDNILMYGRFPSAEEEFSIDSFPQKSQTQITLGFNSIDSGTYYMWLNGKIFYQD